MRICWSSSGDGFPTPNVPRQGPRPNRPQQKRKSPWRGPGFIVSADGFIMTNAHVVKGADEVLVTLTDKREFKAKIIGADERSDVAGQNRSRRPAA